MGQLIRKALVDGIINDAKVDAAAAIALSKLATVTADRALVSNGSGVVSAASVTATELGYVSGVTSAIQTQLGNKIESSEKGANNGVCPLDAGGKISVTYLPNSIMEYKGTWAASTNTPTLANGTGNAGDVYISTDTGTVDFGAGNITFAAGDWVIYNGATWEKAINSNSVVSVNGQTGVVVLDTSHISENTNLYFTDERAQDAVAAAIAAGTHVGIAITYTDASNLFNFEVKYDDSSIGIDGSNQLYVKALGITNAMLAGSIEDSKLSTITTANKVSGSAVQLNAEGSISNDTGLKGIKPVVQVITLNGTDITNQYVTASSTPWLGSVQMVANGYGPLIQGVDYTVSGSTVTFSGIIATAGAAPLESGEVVQLIYNTL